jgi:pimeloyl-ACP methyl ester carboxylesterase
MTVNAVGSIDEAGDCLANFLTYLLQTRGITEICLVGHSMGGLFSRAAIRVLQHRSTPIRISRLVTIGTPWEGSFAADYAAGTIDLAMANGNSICQTCMQEFRKLEAAHPHGAGSQVTRSYLDDSGWNTRQAGVLADIPVTLIGGDYITDPHGSTGVFPNDGLVQLSSALAAGVAEAVLPNRARELIRPDVHSIFFADRLGLEWQQALTWDPVVLDAVADAIA